MSIILSAALFKGTARAHEHVCGHRLWAAIGLQFAAMADNRRLRQVFGLRYVYGESLMHRGSGLQLLTLSLGYTFLNMTCVTKAHHINHCEWQGDLCLHSLHEYKEDHQAGIFPIHHLYSFYLYHLRPSKPRKLRRFDVGGRGHGTLGATPAPTGLQLSM